MPIVLVKFIYNYFQNYIISNNNGNDAIPHPNHTHTCGKYVVHDTLTYRQSLKNN